MCRYIEPEVAGGLGRKTIMDTNTYPPIVKTLNYEFNGWLGDDILESFPCFIISERLKKAIKKNNLTGINFDNVIITKSREFIDLYPDKILPNFQWAKISGKMYFDDFIIGKDYRLIISDRAFQILNSFNLKNASFENLEER